MKKFFRFSLYSLLACLATGTLYLQLSVSGFFQIQQVKVYIESDNSSRYASLSALEKVSQEAEKIRGQDLYRVDFSGMQKMLQQEDWIQSFRISRRWPSQLEVLIRPQPVYFSILNERGRLLPVIESGKVLEEVSVARAPQAPVTRQIEFINNVELRLRTLKILKDIPLHGEFSRKSISEISHDNSKGFVLTLSENNISVKLGENQIRQKSLQIAQVMHYLKERQFQARVIDANLSQKVLVRLRKDP
ncbi:MAG: cell division protein FtsQ/DivIB [Bdellovibrionales bacterium]